MADFGFDGVDALHLKVGLFAYDARGYVTGVVFFGALDRSKLSFGERMIVKAVRAPDGDYRNWDDVGAWADGIALASCTCPS